MNRHTVLELDYVSIFASQLGDLSLSCYIEISPRPHRRLWIFGKAELSLSWDMMSDSGPQFSKKRGAKD